ncbi:MAG: DinB family protein [Ferruginibacter sp.]|nr:DinB family protein [Ferruginibacter sp.]
MSKVYRQGAVGALMDEYEKVIFELQEVINDILDEELLTIIDSKTTDPNCKSIQTILSHVIKSGYTYAVYIRNLAGQKMDYPKIAFHLSVKDYQKDLKDVFVFTTETFTEIKDEQLEEFDNSKKLKSSWGQVYDIEQITEHAIVHILRHRRQIEKFLLALRVKN